MREEGEIVRVEVGEIARVKTEMTEGEKETSASQGRSRRKTGCDCHAKTCKDTCNSKVKKPKEKNKEEEKPKSSCSGCTTETSEQMMSCDSCKRWYCKKCSNMTIREMNVICGKHDGVMWNCPKVCKKGKTLQKEG